MTELQNVFSWSISAKENFSECRRRHYWAKYAMWNGWKENASTEQRDAYRLSKMINRYILQGHAVECALLWLLAEARAGRNPSVEEAYQKIARPYLNRCWKESLNKNWRTKPKQYCCLHEHYYPEHHQTAATDMTEQVIKTINTCLAHFQSNLLPALAAADPQAEVPIQTVDTGDPESFVLNDVKIYAIPDYVRREGGNLIIYDWKSGAIKNEHHDQMLIYGLWAHNKLKQKPENIIVRLEYLAAGKTTETALNAEAMETALELVGSSIADMREYLEDGDLKRNRPLPREDWEMTADHHLCRFCNFYELCKPEFEF